MVVDASHKAMWYKIISAYEDGCLPGAPTVNEVAEQIGISPRQVGRVMSLLGFDKQFSPDGIARFYPPRKRRSKIEWPADYALVKQFLDRGFPDHVGRQLVGLYGVPLVEQAWKTWLKDPSLSIYSECRKLLQEHHGIHKKNTSETISVAELAEILRESPNMPKEGVLNRARGLVKAATRKGNWDDHSPNRKEKEKDNGTT